MEEKSSRDMSDEIGTAIESPSQDEALALVRELDAYQVSLYPPESNHLLDTDSLAAPDIRFFVARRGCWAATP